MKTFTINVSIRVDGPDGRTSVERERHATGLEQVQDVVKEALTSILNEALVVTITKSTAAATTIPAPAPRPRKPKT